MAYDRAEDQLRPDRNRSGGGIQAQISSLVCADEALTRLHAGRKTRKKTNGDTRAHFRLIDWNLCFDFEIGKPVTPAGGTRSYEPNAPVNGTFVRGQPENAQPRV